MKFVFEFDTVTKKAVATMDGQPVADLRHVEAYTCSSGKPGESPDFCLRLRQIRLDEPSGVSEERCVYAAADGSLADGVPTDALADVARHMLRRMKGG
jgi:hypothetical protein